MANKSDLVIIADYASADKPLSLHEFIEITHLPADDVYQYVLYDIIHQNDTSPEDWVFNLRHIQRVQRALRLQRDLEVNLAGVSILLDLLDEMDNMRQRMELLEKLYNR